MDGSDFIDQFWRDRARRSVDEKAFLVAFDAMIAALRSARLRERLPRNEDLQAIPDEARRHPESPREIPPLPPDQVGVEEVMAILRRVVAGNARPIVEYPWREVQHTLTSFVVDGWRMTGFRRSYGIKYPDHAIAPDGRVMARRLVAPSTPNRRSHPARPRCESTKELKTEL